MTSGSSMLSPAVHNLVCELGMKSQGRGLVAAVQNELILDESCTLNWPYLDQLLSASGSGLDKEGNCYKTSVERLANVFDAVESHMMCMTSPARQQLVAKCSWTGNEKVFQQSLDGLLELDSQHNTVLPLLKMTATLERAFGDVYLVRSKPVPCLLKDLLASAVLKDIFGTVPMNVLDVLIGPPVSLNLRNIAWHGFLSSTELPKRYCLFLLAVVAGLGDILLHKNLVIPRRNLVTLSEYSQLNMFPVLDAKQLEELEDVGMLSSLFPEPLICWKDSFLAIKNNRNADAVYMLCPLLENTLRRIFVLVNSCPARLLTAEASVLYTTFNEILSEKLDDVDNQVRDVVGENFLVLLFDLLILPNGPRLRDRLSHGEIVINSITRELVNYILCTAVAACTTLKRLQFEEVPKELDCIQRIMAIVRNYKSVYASHALLIKQETVLLSNLKSMNSVFVILTTESSTVEEKVCYVEDLSFDGPLATTLTEVACDLWNKVEENSKFDVSNFIHHGKSNSDHLKVLLSSLEPKILYRPQVELELSAGLRQISTATCAVIEGMQDVLQTRYEQYLQHELRSRQRATYQRMTDVLPILCSALRFVILLITADTLCLCQEKYDLWTAKSRNFRLLRRFVENLEVMTTIKKNRWTEARSLTEEFVAFFTKLKNPK